MLYNGIQEVISMEKQMIEILLDLQKDFKEFRGELKETKLDVKTSVTI
jgi:hypothetical protein